MFKKLFGKFSITPKYKIVLANLVHKIAMRLYRESKRFVSLLIKYAIYLSPDRKLFWNNLEKIACQEIGSYRKKTFPYDSIIEKHAEFVSNYTKISEAKSIDFTMPITTPKASLSPEYIGKAIIPETYIATIEDAQIFAQTDLIIVNNKVYYDEIDRDCIKLYAIKSPNISNVTTKELTLKIPKPRINKISKAIHLTKDHSKNYFHWLIEILPRLSLIDEIDKDVPILVSNYLPPQFYEALKVINQDNRPVIKLDVDKNYLVNTLFYPSRLSIVNDNYNQPIYTKDAVYSPEAIKFVRETVLDSLKCTNKKGKRKIFISRSGSRYRQLLNSTEIERVLIDRGFEIVFPENMSFSSQVRIFSDAAIIIGQSGAGIVNFIFAPTNCKVIVLVSNAAENNLQLFNALAIASNIHMEFVTGKYITFEKNNNLQADFDVDLTIFSNYLDKLLQSST